MQFIIVIIIITPSPPKKYRRILISHFFFFTREDAKKEEEGVFTFIFINYYTFTQIEMGETLLSSPDARHQEGKCNGTKKVFER